MGALGLGSLSSGRGGIGAAGAPCAGCAPRARPHACAPGRRAPSSQACDTSGVCPASRAAQRGRALVPLCAARSPRGEGGPYGVPPLGHACRAPGGQLRGAAARLRPRAQARGCWRACGGQGLTVTSNPQLLRRALGEGQGRLGREWSLRTGLLLGRGHVCRLAFLSLLGPWTPSHPECGRSVGFHVRRAQRVEEGPPRTPCPQAAQTGSQAAGHSREACILAGIAVRPSRRPHAAPVTRAEPVFPEHPHCPPVQVAVLRGHRGCRSCFPGRQSRGCGARAVGPSSRPRLLS